MLSSTGTTLTPSKIGFGWQEPQTTEIFDLRTFHPPLRSARILSHSSFQNTDSVDRTLL